MREYKFRAWKHTDTPEMFNDVATVDFENKIVWIRYKISEQKYRKDYVDFSKLELMQYTGLKDKNGTEIYEGDILKRGDFPEEEPEFIVRFGEFTDSPDFYHELEYSGWYVERIGKNDKYNTSLVYVINMLDGVVCGNIYENHELLEDTK